MFPGRESRQIRLSKNQALFREVNERVEKISEEITASGLLSFVCECSNPDCGTQIELTREEYERVRSVPSHFAVAVGHEILDIEDVVEATDRFEIVEKIEAGRSVALTSDPRGS